MTHETPQRILALMPVLGLPRHAKRIAQLQGEGFAVDGLAFQRPYHAGRMPACPVAGLGPISHGHYVRRVFTLAAAIPTVRRALRAHDLAYCFGPDQAALALLAGVGLGRPVVMEVGDVREIQAGTGLRCALVRAFDRLFARRCSLIVATAEGFLGAYYRGRLGVTTPSIVIENKVEATYPPPLNPSGPSFPDRPLRVGWFGVLRCPWTAKALDALAQAAPATVEILAAGHPLPPVDLAPLARHPNVTVRGTFRSPDDLAALYGAVDLAWGFHPRPVDGETSWARNHMRTNRFYESCRYRVPLVAALDSADGCEVARLGLGPLAEDWEIPALVDAVTAITPADLTRWRGNLAALPRNLYEYTTEGPDLARAIRGLGRGMVSGRVSR